MDVQKFLDLNDLQFANLAVYNPEKTFIESAFAEMDKGFVEDIFLLVDSRFVETRYLGSFYSWWANNKLVELHNIEEWVSAEGFDVCDGSRFRSYILECDDTNFKDWAYVDKDEFFKKLVDLEGLPYLKRPSGAKLFFDKDDFELGQWPKAQVWMTEKTGPKLGMVWFF
jgi:hypothetical protein